MKMCKFVFLINDDGYRKYTCHAIESAGASVPCIKGWITRLLFRIHNAEPLNRYFELPFKSFWFSNVVDESGLGREDHIFFVLYESFRMTYSRKLLSHYKNKYKNSTFLYLFTNPANHYNLGRLSKIRDLIDVIVSMNLEDAQKYGFKYMPEEFLFKYPDFNYKDIRSDLFFVGANKGRLPLLIQIFEQIQKQGGVCDFWITDVPYEEQQYAEVIHYNQKLSYEEVLSHGAHSRSILEVLQDGKSYASIRTLEALHYHKKLLTMNKTIKDQWYYNPNIIYCFNSPEEISVSYIRKSVPDSEYNIEIGTYEKFVSNVIEVAK